MQFQKEFLEFTAKNKEKILHEFMIAYRKQILMLQGVEYGRINETG